MASEILQALRRNHETGTGLSLKDGDLVVVVSDLPEHRIEIHAFDDANFAQAFVEGLALVANNSVAWTWEHGTHVSNRNVIVARFNEERPAVDRVEDAVAVIAHERNRLESKVVADHLAAQNKRDAAEADEHRRMMAPLREALSAAGIPVNSSARLWLRCGEHATIELRHDGIYEIDYRIRIHRCDGDEPLIERYREHFATAGLPFEPYDFPEQTAGTPEEAVALVSRLDAAERGVEAIAKAFWQERFMANFKLTKQTRTFLIGAGGEDLSPFYTRANLNLYAGGVTLKASAINDLVRAGYLSKSGNTFKVTGEGTAAALRK